MNKRTGFSASRKAARIIFAVILILAIVISVSVLSASAYEVKGKTLAQVLGMNGSTYYQWLMSHRYDKYYNTTPYAHADHRNPNGDCKGANGALDTPGVPALNCMGFVWHAIYMPTKMSGGNTDLIPAYGKGGWYGLYTGYNLTRRYFNSKRDLLASGYAQAGDIIWMFVENEHVSDDSNHIAIYMGNGHSDRVWHAVKAGTKFGCINPDYEEYMVIKSGAVRTLGTPKLKSVTNIASGAKITWNKVSGAYYYRVFVKNGKSWKLLGQTNRPYFVDKKAKSGKTYTYTVRCVEKNGKPISSFNKKGISNTFYSAPGGFSVDGSSGTGIKVTWKKVAGAPKYAVLRKTAGGTWTRIKTTTGTSIVDNKAAAGKKYYYTIRVMNKSGRYASAYKSPIMAYYLKDVPKINNSTVDSSGLTLKWNAIKGAEQYVVYKRANGAWKRVGLTKQNKIVIKNPSKNVNVKYTVRCINSTAKYFTSKYDSAGYITGYFDTPQITNMEAIEDGITLAWSGSNNVEQFNVYRRDNGQWVRIATTDEKTYTDHDAVEGNTYVYTVRCVTNNQHFSSLFNSAGWSMKYVETPVPAAAQAAGGIRVSWNAVEGAAKYMVLIKQDGEWVELATTEDTEYLYADHQGAYTFTVRCVDENDWFNSYYNTDGAATPELAEQGALAPVGAAPDVTEAPGTDGTEPADDPDLPAEVGTTGETQSDDPAESPSNE